MQTMKKHFTLLTSAACFLAFLTFASAAPGQTNDPAAKLQALSQQLKLTPEQKIQMLPILKEEGPKIEAIKNNTSLPPMQKMKQLRAIHSESAPREDPRLRQGRIDPINSAAPSGRALPNPPRCVNEPSR